MQRKRGQFARDPMPYGNVLVVDDVETNLYVAAGLLKLYGLQIDTVMSGKEALDKIKNGKVYDIIFMDHMMPEMDGIEATKHIRNFGYTSPVIALTANAVAGQADIFLRNGFDDFISKPIDIRQLNAVLNKLVRDKQPPEVIQAARLQKENNNLNSTIPQVDQMLLESFIRDADKAVVNLGDYLSMLNSAENTDTKEVLRKFTIVVHGIKSSLWNIGETVLAETAFRLEAAGRDNEIDLIKTITPDFLKDMRVLLEKNTPKQEEYTLNEDITDLCDKLHLIKKMCEDYNRKGALDILAEIKNYSRETKVILDNIMGHVLHSEFEEAENAASNYLNELSLEVNK